MTLEQYGAYHKLLDLSWVSTPQCFLRNDPDYLAKLLKISRKKFDQIWKKIGHKFEVRSGSSMRRILRQSVDDSYIFNRRLLEERKKQRRRYLQAVENGRRGGRNTKLEISSSRKPEPFPQKKPDCYPLSFSSSYSSKDKPSQTLPKREGFSVSFDRRQKAERRKAEMIIGSNGAPVQMASGNGSDRDWLAVADLSEVPERERTDRYWAEFRRRFYGHEAHGPPN